VPLLTFRGHSASPGLATGRAFWVADVPVVSVHRKISRQEVREEKVRLAAAYVRAHEELKNIETKSQSRHPQGLKDIFSAHRLMLEDPIIRSRIEASVRRRLICAEWAVEGVYDEIAGVFSSMKNRHQAGRMYDVKDVMRVLLDHLAGAGETAIGGELANLPDAPFIAIAHELSPARTAAFIGSKVAGMVTRLGGRTSHAAIIAREIGIPFVFGLPSRSLNRIKPDDMLLVNGGEGSVVVNPPAAISRRFRGRQSEIRKIRKTYQRIAARPTRTRDGVDVRIWANIETENEIPGAKKYGACGVGLFRTEYLYLQDQMPDEQALYEVYRKVARAVSPGSVVVRTMDLGGDKFLSPIEFPSDMNPMLGMRAIRLCLAQPKLLIPQLRAALRANLRRNLRLCLPMVSAVEEILEVRKYLDHAVEDLRRSRTPFCALPLGIMVEVPSVAIRIERFLPHADFFSIGTNDLIQYTLAVSRTMEQVAYLYRPLDPSVLWLISRVVSVCRDSGKEVSLCGEEANNPLIVPFLLGVGLRDLSMAPPAILEIKSLISGLEIPRCQAIARRMLEFSTAREVERYLRSEVFPMLKTIIPHHYSYVSLESEL